MRPQTIVCLVIGILVVAHIAAAMLTLWWTSSY